MNETEMMKVRSLFLCLFGGLLGLVGCTVKRMPEGSLVRVELTRSGTMAGYEWYGCAEPDSTGVFVLRAMKENYGPLFQKQLSRETMNQFRQIIEDEKMFKYKESYRPKMEVLDGWGWSFRAKFSDGSSISSHGSNASPKGDGLARIQGLMAELIQDGIQVEFPEEEN